MNAARDRLIVALDVPSVEHARALVEELQDSVGVYKIGLELLFSGGLTLANELVTRGAAVFIDAKLLDIEATVERATAAIARTGAEFLTVHATDRKTLDAAMRGRGQSGLTGAQPHHQFRHFDGSAGGQNHDLLGVSSRSWKAPPESQRHRHSRGVDGGHHCRPRTGDHRPAAAGGVQEHCARRRKIRQTQDHLANRGHQCAADRGRLSRMAGVAAEPVHAVGRRCSPRSCFG